jgi:hypothetical protein
MVELSST